MQAYKKKPKQKQSKKKNPKNKKTHRSNCYRVLLINILVQYIN